MNAAGTPIRVLIVDDDMRVARALASVLSVQGCECSTVDSAEAAIAAAERDRFDVLVTDYRLEETNGIELLKRLRARGHTMPCIVITGAAPNLTPDERALAAAILEKPFPAALLNQAVVRAASAGPEPAFTAEPPTPQTIARAIQALALARDRQSVLDVVRHAARSLVAADGAAVALREHDLVHYVDEDAIAPLYKGRRFPLSGSLAGKCMLERQPVRVLDLYADPQVPAESYVPTFVKSLVMVPIRQEEPIGAIGAYWGAEHAATETELELLATLADSASVALHNADQFLELEDRVAQRTQQLAAVNRELELFTSAAAHDLSGPLAAIYANAETVLLAGSGLGPGDRACLDEIRAATVDMSWLLGNLLRLSRMATADLRRHPIDVSRMAEELCAELRAREPQRKVDVTIEPNLVVEGDPELVRIALQNLLANAWKYTGKRDHAHIAFGETWTERGRALFVRDDGAGFDPAKAGQLFLPFRRLHDRREFPGTGIGLVTVARIAAKHGGQCWAESELGRGATFYLQLGRVDSRAHDEPSAAAAGAG